MISNSTIEVKDLITIIAVAISVVGWFFNSRANRKNEIAKERLKHRLPVLKSFLKIKTDIRELEHPFMNADFISLIKEVSEGFEFYGKDDERKMYSDFLRHCIDQDLDSANKTLNLLFKIISDRLRKELDIKG